MYSVKLLTKDDMGDFTNLVKTTKYDDLEEALDAFYELYPEEDTEDYDSYKHLVVLEQENGYCLEAGYTNKG